MFRILILLTVLPVAVANAGTQQEIDHLLEFVADTSCRFDRNGSMHNGREARDHINMKYEYYRRKINTSEDFIKYSATKSKFSGRMYKIHCAGSDVMNTSDWLLEELHEFRNPGRITGQP